MPYAKTHEALSSRFPRPTATVLPEKASLITQASRILNLSQNRKNPARRIDSSIESLIGRLPKQIIVVAPKPCSGHAIMLISDGFGPFLAPRLADGHRLRVHHLSTPPIVCPPLYAASPKGPDAEKTWCESHFLAISQPSAAEVENGSSVLVLGLEVLIFTSENLTTIFVSKADSTGYLFRDPTRNQQTSVALATTTAFLEYLVRPRLTGPRLVLSLFARSQNQYLFPGSIENASKRILDDRQLIKWWCRVLDPVIRSELGVTQLQTKAYVVVPGCEQAETRAFFPPSARHDSPTEAKWENQYPVTFLSQNPSLPPRCVIPRLPDDPKARFLDDLDGAQVNDDGSWKGVKSLDQFWEMMSYRQECSAGRLVGFIWATFSLLSSDANAPGHVTGQTFEGSERDLHDPTKIETKSDDEISRSRSERCLPWPEPSRGQLILTAEQYASLTDHLLQLDFAGEEIARESTQSWIAQAIKLAAADDFGVDVEGSLILPDVPTIDVCTTPVANVLTGVRKKRKAASTKPAEDTSAHDLDLDALRKKARA